MIDEKKVQNVKAPLLTSNSKVIQAADAALTALNKSFDDVIEKDYWLAEKMKKAALEAALASITILKATKASTASRAGPWLTKPGSASLSAQP
ncbi:hypothetical protein SGI63_003232 [Enterobacter cloacae]|nr:hypothetical protein [Enterobacter cloacae]